MIAPHRLHTAPSDDVVLSARLFGNETANPPGTPVLFIHGLSFFSYDWVDFGAGLCQDRPGAAMDMRGFGDSTPSTRQDYRIATMAADIGNLLDSLGWKQAFVVAHSMGGRSATYFTASHPDRVRGLVLVDWSPENAPAGSRRVATSVAEAPPAFASIDEAMRYFGANKDAANAARVRERYTQYLRQRPEGFVIKRDAFFQNQFKHQLATGEKPKHDVDLWKALGDLSVPTLVLRGSRSDLFAAETVPKVRAANPRISLAEIDAGHNVAGDNPAEAAAAIRGFINHLEK